MLDRHLVRLAASARALGIALHGIGFPAAVEAVLGANGLSEARIRITVSAGEGEMNADPATCGRPTVMVAATQYHSYAPKVYEAGFKAGVSPIGRNTGAPSSSLKALSFLDSVLARANARAAGADEAVMLNEKGLLASASMGNIFLVNGGQLMTPPVSSGILPGITRQVVLELADREGIEATEVDITLDQLRQADEAFITNSLIELMPVTVLDSRPIGPGKPGPVTEILSRAYRALVAASG
jgi:branched-subunit amino acid aminotransferase/4-amino-4-deoxychorismate lyase